MSRDLPLKGHCLLCNTCKICKFTVTEMYFMELVCHIAPLAILWMMAGFGRNWCCHARQQSLMNCKPVYLRQQEHTLENTLILVLGKVCIQNSSNGNIKVAQTELLIEAEMHLHSWEKRGHSPSSTHCPTAISELLQWRAALGLLYMMPTFLPAHSHLCPRKIKPAAAQWLSKQAIPCSGSVSPGHSSSGNPKPPG